MFLKTLAKAFVAAALMTPAFAQSNLPNVRILLPERTRLLEGQLVDLVIEVRNATSVSGLTVYSTSDNLTSKFGSPVKTELDCDSTSDYVYRANLQSFPAGTVELSVTLTADGGRQHGDRQADHRSTSV